MTPRPFPLVTPRSGLSRATDAPTPWRIVRGFGELTAVVDAHHRTLFITASESIADRIVAAVNAMEPGGRSPF